MNLNLKSFQILSGSSLKIIAVIAMTIDHFAASILYHGILIPAAPFSKDAPEWKIYLLYQAMRFIGRIAFPIFCFLLVEGFFYTSNRKKYAIRLFLFALISEFPFDLALFHTPMTWKHQNVFFTLFIGFLTIWAMEYRKYFTNTYLQKIICFLAGCGIAYVLKTDYDYLGITLIVVLYLFRTDRTLQTIAGCFSLIWEPRACLAFIPLNMYNGQRGLSLKSFFYWFYPVHLLLLGIILQLL